MIGRPFRWPDYVWPVGGGALLLALGILPIGSALEAVGKGADVYPFLAGMMLLSEAARAHGVFEWTAAMAVRHARGSSSRLFALVYATGILTTAFLSNDATAIVLTPAVYAVAKRARVDTRPLLFVCALVANAASFVLPISNPANLVLYGSRPPALGPWLASFALPSAAAIAVTYGTLRWTQRSRIAGRCDSEGEPRPLSNAGRGVLAAIGLTAASLVAASAAGIGLGLPTAIAGAVTTFMICLLTRRSPIVSLRSVSWSVLPLVAGLFVLVGALERTGMIMAIARPLRSSVAHPAIVAAGSGAALAFAANLVNNLPAGLVAATAIAQAHPPRLVVDALLIGVDLGPNLSITGSLATILWLQAIRREGEDVGFRDFLKVGLATMPPALTAALAVRILIG